MNRNPELRPDASTPNPLPHPRIIREQFERALFYEPKQIEDPEYRMAVAQSMYEPERSWSKSQYIAVSQGLHQTLTSINPRNALFISGRRTFRSGFQDDLLFSTTGMHLQSDFHPLVIPALYEIIDDIGKSDVPLERKIARVAGVAGLATAESQSFSDGNSRIARAIFAFIARGPGSVNQKDIFGVRTKFSPTDDVENLIMLQNLSAILDERDSSERFDSTRRITDDAANLYAKNLDIFQDIYRTEPMSQPDPDDMEAVQSARLETRSRIFALEERLASMLDIPDREEEEVVTNVLRQRKYGAAAWTVAFRDVMPKLPLSGDDAVKLQQAQQKLMTDRVIALSAGVAAGGRFTGSYLEGGAVAHTEFEWTPDLMST